MNYQKIYDKIITQHASNVKRSGDEKHHINPVSLGGDDGPENLAFVSPRVHYLLHLLLYRMTEGEDRKKMWFAVWNMSHQGKVKTGSMYQFIREQRSQQHSEMMKGKTPWNKGRKWDDATKEKWRKTRKGKSYGKTWKIEYKGVVYNSIKECSAATGDSYYKITTYGTKLEKHRTT